VVSGQPNGDTDTETDTDAVEFRESVSERGYCATPRRTSAAAAN
jgi:hypothetical protein